jgi:hypothetical protein
LGLVLEKGGHPGKAFFPRATQEPVAERDLFLLGVAREALVRFLAIVPDEGDVPQATQEPVAERDLFLLGVPR